MLGFDVASQVDFALEATATFLTGERLETAVLATVCDEVRRLAERLPALQTFVRLLACKTRRRRKPELV